MKKFCLAIMFLVGFVASMWIENTYNREASVVSVKNGVTTFEDLTGNLWEAETTEFEYGSEVILIMFNNHTDTNIYDDEIIKALIK